MKRFFRIEYDGTPRHVVEDDRGVAPARRGPLRRVRGRATRSPSTGHRLLAPVVPSKIVCRRPELQGPRGRAEQAAAGRAADLPQAVDGGRSVPASRSCCPTGSAASTTRPRSGVVIGARAPAACARRTRRLRLRAHLRQRRHRARAAEEGRPVHARQGVRHVRAARAVHRDRARLRRGRRASRSRAGSTATRRQASSTRELIFPIDRLIAFISSVMTLLPGDIISTGTPSGIGPLQAGDRVTIKVEGVGELTQSGRARQSSA